MKYWIYACVLLGLCVSLARSDTCTDNLNRCARMRPQIGFTYEIGNQPVYQWVANLLLIDPSAASTVCRDWQFYVSTITCIRRRLTEHACWSTSKYYWVDRYVPEERTLRGAMEVFCDPAKREEKINLNNCMLLNAKEQRSKEQCLRTEEEKALKRFGHSVNDRSMCSFFHARMNCYRIYFGAICKSTLQQHQQIYNAITMEEYFDPLRKASICHIIEGAGSVKAGVLVLLVCIIIQMLTTT